MHLFHHGRLSESYVTPVSWRAKPTNINGYRFMFALINLISCT